MQMLDNHEGNSMKAKAKDKAKAPARRGRPPIDNPANMRMNVRVTAAQRDAYHAAAEQAGLTLTAWLERLANRASGYREDAQS